MDYFDLRGGSPKDYADYNLPAYIANRLPADKNSLIIDFGCGFGQVISAIRDKGYTNLLGLDISEEALAHCRTKGLNVAHALSFAETPKAKFIVLSHVLEHIQKKDIPAFLARLKSFLATDGQLLICVPNAQSNTGCYWAYEDFTHEMLFTSGSLLYVLRAAGFKNIQLIDRECMEGISCTKKLVRKIFLTLYKLNYKFWNKITSSGTYKGSPDIFSYEIKALCS